MPFDEKKFRVSVETGGIDTVNELGLPRYLNFVGNITWFNELPTLMKDHEIREMYGKMCIYHAYPPASPEKARYAIEFCLWAIDGILHHQVADLINSVPEEQWKDIVWCIALYEKVFNSVRKPFNSIWSKRDKKNRVTWINHNIGVDPKIPAHVYEHSAWVDARLSVGLPVDDDRWKLSSSVMMCWDTKAQQSESATRVVGRINSGSPLFQELMETACHPERYFKNCINVDQFEYILASE